LRRRLHLVHRWSPQLLAVMPHEATINFGEFAPDGRHLVTLSGREARLWKDDASPLHPPLLHVGDVRTAAFTPDGKTLLTVAGTGPWGYRGAVYLWDVETGERIAGPLLHEGRAPMALVTPDARRVVTIEDREIGRDYYEWKARLWNAATGEVIADLGELQTSWGSYDASLSDDGRQVAVALGPSMHLFDTESGDELCPPWNGRDVTHCCFTRDGTRLAIASSVAPRESRRYEAEIQVVDVESGSPLGAVLHPRSKLHRMWFSDDGARLVAVGQEGGLWIGDIRNGNRLGGSPTPMIELPRPWISADGLLAAVPEAPSYMSLRVWNLATGRPLTPFLHHTALIAHAAFSADGQRLLTTSIDQTARVWNLIAGPDSVPPLVHQEPGGEIHWTRICDNGRRVLVCYDETSLQLRPIKSSEAPSAVRHITDTHADDGSNEEQATADGRYFLYRDQDGAVMRLDVLAGQTIRLAESDPDFSPDIHLAPDSERALIIRGSQAENLQADIYSLSQGRVVGTLMDVRSGYSEARWSDDGRRLALFRGGELHLFDTQQGDLIGRLEADSSAERRFVIQEARFSPDSQWLAILTNDYHDEPGRSFLADGRLHVWQASDGRPRFEPLAVEGFLSDVQFSPDSRRLLTVANSRQNQFGPPATKDWGEVRVREVLSGKPLGQPIRHQNHCQARFTQDNQRIVTAGDDNTARVWSAAHGTPLTPPMQGSGSAFAVSADQQLLATVVGPAVYVWDLNTGELVTPAIMHPHDVYEVAFDSLSLQLLTNSGEMWFVWDLSPDRRELSELTHWSTVVALQRLDAAGGRSSVRSLDAVADWNELRAARPSAASPLQSRTMWQQQAVLDAIEVSHWDAALQRLDRCLAHDPRDWRLWMNQGLVWEELEQWPRAINSYTQALNLVPDQVGLLFQRADVHLRHDRWAEAADDFGMAAYYFALTALAAGRSESYRQACRQLVDLGPQSAVDQEELIELCLLAPDAIGTEQLRELAEKEVSDAKRSVSMQDRRNFAAALYRQGRYAEALTELSALAEIEHRNASHRALLFLFLSMTQSQLGNAQQSRDWLQKASGPPAANSWQARAVLSVLQREALELLALQESKPKD
jgi:WD40 repeat protein/tetratricopeptide (TPR) repeat protein